MVGRFEKTIPLAAGTLVAGLIGLAVFDPPKPDTAIPPAMLTDPAGAATFETAAGPTVSQNMVAGLLRVNAPGETVESVIGAVHVRRALAAGQAASLHTADALHDTFERLDYDLEAVTLFDKPVPRVFLASLPRDLAKVREPAKRKTLFFRAVLPLILHANEEIAADRERLWNLHARLKRGQKLAAVDRLWLIVMSERYRVERGNIQALLKRVDVVPPSLALAQAAEESGWGTSRFSRQGNAIFGQWTFDENDGLVPREREDGKSHRVKAFDSLLQSVRAYARNLNTHRAYREFRNARADMRRAGTEISGRKLVDTLRRYSERGAEYVKTLRAIMVANKLSPLDDARLRQHPRTGADASAI